jgi:hypothetical protein
MALFTTKTENASPEDKQVALDALTQKYSTHEPLPERAYLCSLFTGVSNTGKSGVAISFLSLIEPDEKIFYLDLEIGAWENIIEYWEEEYNRDQIIYEDLRECWEEDPSRENRKIYFNYDKAMEQLRRIAMWLDKYGEKMKIKMVALDGLGTFKDYIEWQMKLEKDIALDGDPSRKFWRERNKEFIETLKLYKALPMDMILIGSEIFNKPPGEQQSMDRQVNDLVSQKVVFEKDIIDGVTHLKARIKKSRQNVKSSEGEIDFAEIDFKKGKYSLDGKKVFDAIISEKKKAKSKKSGF